MAEGVVGPYALLESSVHAAEGVLGRVCQAGRFGLPGLLGPLVQVDRGRPVVVEGDAKLGHGGHEGLGLLALLLLNLEALAGVLVNRLVHDGLRGRLGIGHDGVLALDVLVEILRRSAQNLAVQDLEGAVALRLVDLLDVVFEGPFEPVRLLVVQGEALALLEVGHEKALEGGVILLTEELGPDRRRLLDLPHLLGHREPWLLIGRTVHLYWTTLLYGGEMTTQWPSPP